MRNYQAAYESLYVSFFLSTLSIFVTVTMFYLSRFVVKEFCFGCAILWMINLSIWPALVKQLGLNWGSALFANRELLRSKTLKRNRIFGSFVVGLGSLVIFSLVGAYAKGLQGEQEGGYEESSLLNDFKNAPQVFLPAEILGGAQSKGFKGEGAPVLEIVEFADFQCPACRIAAQYLKPFVLKHGSK